MLAFCSASRMDSLPSLVEPADGGENILHDTRCEAHRGLIEQQQARTRHQRAADRQHLLLAARQKAGCLFLSLGKTRKEVEYHLHVGGDGAVAPGP